ncbi:hypothetical protein [Photobacterium nomapromontoriensis]|uniref:hypothetical protein n=1 Tax=Photobacterium nomapromontoriensis TaxID=2910237 RepID=UPI003D0C5D5E
MKKKEVNQLIELINKTSCKLEEHLNIYTPVINSDKNGIHEANLTLQFAHQCLGKGWFVYPEASNVYQDSSAKKPIRLDLHVICRDEFILTVESKKLYSVDKGKELIADFKRAQSIQYPHCYNDLPHFILLLAVTESSEYENWWCQSHNWQNDTPVWQELAQILEREGMVKSSFAIDADKTHYLLYAITQVR